MRRERVQAGTLAQLQGSTEPGQFSERGGPSSPPPAGTKPAVCEVPYLNATRPDGVAVVFVQGEALPDWAVDQPTT